MTAIEALALATIVRPDGAAPATLERAVRSACAGGWRAVEVVLAGDALRDRLAASEAGVRLGVEAVFGVFGRDVPTRREALATLRRARRDGILDGNLDMTALAAGCGRVGDAPAVAAGRRRVRTFAVDSLRRALADHRALAAPLGDSAISALLVDTARAVFRHASRNDKALARWAAPPTGTTSRDQALSSFVELVASSPSIDELENLIASVDHGATAALPANEPLRSEPSPPVEDAKRSAPAVAAPDPAVIAAPAPSVSANQPEGDPPLDVPACKAEPAPSPVKPALSPVESASAEPASRSADPISNQPPFAAAEPASPRPTDPPPTTVDPASRSAEPVPQQPPSSAAEPASLRMSELPAEPAPSRAEEPAAAATIARSRTTDEPAEVAGNSARLSRWIVPTVVAIAIVAAFLFYAMR